jgi:hypothetical protein
LLLLVKGRRGGGRDILNRRRNQDQMKSESRGDHFWFGSVFIKKSNQTEIFFLKKKPKPGQTD